MQEQFRTEVEVVSLSERQRVVHLEDMIGGVVVTIGIAVGEVDE